MDAQMLLTRLRARAIGVARDMAKMESPVCQVGVARDVLRELER